MPLDGSLNYYYPPGTSGIPDTTIESEKYNTFIDDLVGNDLNVPRPVHRGGTGASTAVQALINLGSERTQQVVTNYDDMVWMSGSFYSAIGATAAPSAGRAVGYVAVQDANNIVLEAFDLDSTPIGMHYQRIKKDGVWGAWVLPNIAETISFTPVGDIVATNVQAAIAELDAEQNAGDALRVLKAGDTMNGDLIISKNNAALILSKPSNVGALTYLLSRTVSANRWHLIMGDATAEIGIPANFGSDFSIGRYNDVGNAMGDVLFFKRATGLGTVAGDPVDPLGIAASSMLILIL